MAFEPSTEFEAGLKLRTTYGRTYEILAGPFGDNTAVWYAVMDVQDTMVHLKAERLLEGLEEVSE